MIRFLPLICCLLAVPAFAQVQQGLRTVSVTGEGQVKVEPDEIVVTLGVQTFATDLKEATDQLEDRSADLLKAIMRLDVPEKDVQTTSVRVYPRYRQPASREVGQQQQIEGFSASRLYRVTLRDPEKFQALLRASFESGANTLQGFSFETSRRDELMTQARKEAVADAKARAELLAGELGMQVGLPRSIQETGVGYNPPTPMMQSARVEADAGGRTTALGEITVTAGVEVTFDLVGR
ncbi:MAG: SIMPL domain-containing protein [Phycisphaerae bacterium]